MRRDGWSIRLIPALGLFGEAAPPLRVEERLVCRFAAPFRAVFFAEARLAPPRLEVRLLLLFRVGDTGGVVGDGMTPRRATVA